MKYFFYIDKKSKFIKFYDKTGKNKVDKSTFDIKSLSLTKAEEEQLDIFGHKKVINNKLVFEESLEEIKKKDKIAKINNASSVGDLKQIMLEELRKR